MKLKFWQRIFYILLITCLLLSSTWQQGVASTDDGNSVNATSYIAMDAGGAHACAVTSAGGVKCWGSNGDGELGDGSTTDRSIPVDVVGLSSGVKDVTAGGHTCALTSNGGVKCWGDNQYGQLGDGTTEDRHTPVDVVGLSDGVIAVSAGGYYTCALVSGGTVKCWGNNDNGQLGDGTTEDHYTPVNVSGLSSGVMAVSAGWHHTCALISGGGLKCWGNNDDGQLGDGTTDTHLTPVNVNGLTSGVSAVSSSESHTCAVTSAGSAKCWGYNGSGRLGDGTVDINNRLTPVDVVGLSTGVADITAGGNHSCALMLDGGAKCWGWNRFGNLGNGTTEDNSAVPTNVFGLSSGVGTISAGGEFACALISGGTVKCWGYNGSGQLGDGVLNKRSLPTEVMGLPDDISGLSTGWYHTCVLTSIGGVKCWGLNFYGQLGDGNQTNSSVPVDVVGLSSGVQAISAGRFESCALTSTGGLKCWPGYSGDHFIPEDWPGLTSGVTAVAEGGRHGCALLEGGGVKCWGDNYGGQLGDGTTEDSDTPVDVVGLSSGVTAIAAGELHTCALTSSGGVKCWGYNYSGQLGDGTWDDRYTPVDVVGLTTGVLAITAGEWHTCALMVGGGVKCWGNNNSGELGDGITTDSTIPVGVVGLSSGVTSIAGGYGFTCAVMSGTGGAKCWGGNDAGQLGDGTLIDRHTPIDVSGLASEVTKIEAGESHACALVGNGRVKCWGGDSSGQLGLGTNVFSNRPIMVLDAAPLLLTLGYTSGQPGSILTVTGRNFPPDSLAAVAVNGQVIDNALVVNPTGSFIFFLDTTGAEIGGYALTVRAGSSATATFRLAEDAPLRPPEGGGQVLDIPGEIAYHNFVYLPLATR